MPRPISSRMTSARGAGLVQDRRGLDHLDHEGRAAARQVVGGADPAEQLVDDADLRRRRRHEGAHLRQHRDQRVLPQVGRLAGHVRPGDQPERPRLRRRRRRARCRWRRSCRRSAAAPARPPDAGRRRCGTRGPRRPPAAPSPRPRARSASAARDVDLGQRLRGRRRSRPARSSTAARRSSKIRRSISSAWPPAFRIFVSISASASVVKRIALGRGLAVHEELGERRLQHPLGMRRRRLDEVAEHVVVPDLQRVDAALAHVLGLQLGDHPAALVAQPPGLVELLVEARRDEAAVAHQERRLGDQRRVEQRRSARRARRARRAPRPAPRAARPPAPRAAARPAPARRGPPRDRAGRRGRAPAATARARGPAPGAARSRTARPTSGASWKCATASCRARTSRTSVDGPFSRVSSSRAPAAGDRAVDRGEQRAVAPAGEAAGQLEVAPGRRVDLHQPAGALAHRRAQQRQPPALGQLEIVDDRAERRRPRPGRRRRSRRAPSTL